MAKDLFSTQADFYARYRPTYPKELFDYITGFVKAKDRAWDCATGNGQAANMLADYFSQVEATDISEAQLANAVRKENIHYQLSPAEKTPFPDNSFDLITIATAYHWLKWDDFHTEATRVGKKDCVVAAWAYNLLSCQDDAVTDVINWFYKDIIGTYWDKERRFLEESYQAVLFDFAPLPAKDFELVLHWKKEALLGFFSSWSSVQNYIKKNGTNPVSLVEVELKKVWPADDEKEFRFPLFLRIGRVIK